jgi:hypothetical protein
MELITAIKHQVLFMLLPTGVARWYTFRPKIVIWVNFVGSCNGCCYILWTLGLFYGHFIYFMTIRYILWQYGIFSPCCTKKNLATLVPTYEDNSKTQYVIFELNLSNTNPNAGVNPTTAAFTTTTTAL